MIAISYSDYLKYGCPLCGCDSAVGGNFSGHGTSDGTCRECGTNFVILADGQRKSGIGYGTGRKDSNGETIFEYPELQKHPRKGTPWHKWVQPDPRPEYGEYWNPRGIGYDLSGFVKSKQAGERLLAIVKEVLGKEEPASWLDWREYEPTWIQFKFQKEEFDLEKLENMAIENDRILNREIFMTCKL